MKIPIDKDRYIILDEKKNTATVVVVPVVQAQIQQAQEKLAQLPTNPGDEELLVWARKNYLAMDYSKEKQYLETQISEAQQLLTIK